MIDDFEQDDHPSGAGLAMMSAYDVASYLASMISELHLLAQKKQIGKVAALLEMAKIEAEMFADIEPKEDY